MRRTLLLVACTGLLSGTAHAQAPAAGPLALLLPASTRAVSVGNAWVASREDASVFYNPAQIIATNGYGIRLARYGAGATVGTLTSAFAIGNLNLGWGAQYVGYKVQSSAGYPLAPSDILTRGTRNGTSLVVATGINAVFKGFRTGAGMKYAEDRLEASSLGVSPDARLNGLILGDVGVSHGLLSGQAALAVQNIGRDDKIKLPVQTSLGWTRSINTSQVDFAIATEVLARNGWVGGGGGAEMSYGWLEGYSASVRAGAHRTETSEQRPISLGGTMNMDRLTVEYALEFFARGQNAHHFTFRWR
ncbi:MAG: hypothetical protein V4550_19580 [Gemmatimonadota bacterium]